MGPSSLLFRRPGIGPLMGTPSATERRTWISVAVGALVVAAMWLSWFFAPQVWSEDPNSTHPDNNVGYDVLVIGLVVMVLLFGWYVWTHSHRDPPLAVLSGLIILVAGLIVVFASAYFNFGSPQNFTGISGHSARLSHLDALSLTAGNLSTAGSPVGPRSQWARGLVIIQQLVDFGFLGFIAAVAIGRLRAPSSPESPQSSEGGPGSEALADAPARPNGR